MSASLLRRADRVWPLLFLLCLLAGGGLSVALGTDRNWDLQNYHLYAPFAWLNGRLFEDGAPAQLQSYFNPFLSLPVYALWMGLQDWPRLYAFVMGLPAGAFGFLVARIAWAHASPLFGRGEAGLTATALAVLAGLTGAAVLPGVGLSANDVAAAVPLALSYLLVLREAERRDAGEPPRLRRLAVAGAAAGLAAGLKLTTVIFAAPIGVMILLLLGLRAALAAGAAMGAGFLLFWAPHALTLWRETGNPLFPLYNHVFRSPDFLLQALADERFLPRSRLQALLYPFWWLRPTTNLVTEIRMRDARVATGYIAFLLAVPLLLWRRPPGGRRAVLLLMGVTAISYLAWARMFGIYRYLVLLEALSVMLVIVALGLAFGRRPVPALAVLGLVVGVLLGTTVHPNWGHGRHEARLFQSDPIPVKPGALVVTLDWEPHAYLVPFLPADVRVFGLHTNFNNPDHDHGLNRRIRAAIAAHDGPIWGVAGPGTPEAARVAVLRAHGLQEAGPCTLVRTSLERGGHLFCPLRRAG
ncbi:hypothetical protein [Sabulicella glaciei]|uniref:Glycosyltransferase RgtA/B/C/D-like domain-containing protein n=1 Tax=Sabulicella glaciei TaxID=2984948 RepID=A0ABT3NS03_9PROT|nr:hypothetical protein [Roseococcus sp. MDT2-1-1]MCW8084936.1 hypothetical protein [Roseococcus sp. MDT2-1-1]